MKTRILLTEDDDVQRDIIKDILTISGYEVTEADSGEVAMETLSKASFDLLLTDMRMQAMDGLQVVREARRIRPDVGVVVMTAHASIETAVAAMREGAVDYLQKPFDKDQLLLVLERGLERHSLRSENERLRGLVSESIAMGNIVGDSAPMREVFNIVSRAVPITSTVLIQGESGTGKEMVARHIHFSGPRKGKPFIVVNCAAIPDTLVESELFGHEKGAFTGAEVTREGKFEVANGGTLFLDEIGDMQVESQAKLLRVLQDGVVERVGSAMPRKVDVRVIAATNRDLKSRVEEKGFREDLYYRLEVLTVKLPPLRDRIEDLSLLVDHFRHKLSARLGRPSPSLSPGAFDALRRYRWPGNVRELEHTLEQAFILCDGDVVPLEGLPDKLHRASPGDEGITLPAGGLVLEEVEQELIRQALDRSGGRIKEAAELLGLTYKTLQYRLKKHDIDRGDLGG